MIANTEPENSFLLTGLPLWLAVLTPLSPLSLRVVHLSPRSLLFPTLVPSQDFFIENINLSLHRFIFITRVTNLTNTSVAKPGVQMLNLFSENLQESANIKFVVLKVQEVYRKIKKIINIGNYSKDNDLVNIYTCQCQ